MKKIGVLTHPLGSNYGGLLQAFALQKALDKLGIESEVVETNYSCNNKIFILHNIKCLLIFIFNYIRGVLTPPYQIAPILLQQIFPSFIDKNIRHTKYIAPQFLKEHNSQYSKFIVGSDQVWRRSSIRGSSEKFMFLDFLSADKRKKSFSYAASFGTDEWEGEKENISECSQLLKEFKAISTREHSGVDICRDTFGVSAVQMPDPTLLLTSDDYNAVIPQNIKKTGGSYLATYILDNTSPIKSLNKALESKFNIPFIHLMPNKWNISPKKNLPINVPLWLASIRGASYMLTDSFHGCVFCIIYNIPFVCLGNKGRGSARFDSLLRTFGLESRLVTDYDAESILTLLHTPIDWERVNAIRTTERERGRAFLKKNIFD